jgi:hypothetical protein
MLSLVTHWTSFLAIMKAISQSINVSCNSYLEHRASTTHRHRISFFAATFTPFKFRPTALSSIWTDLLQVLTKVVKELKLLTYLAGDGKELKSLIISTWDNTGNEITETVQVLL